MTMRNFYMEGDVDGRKTPFTGGPKTKDGGMLVTMHMRNNGRSEPAVRVNGWLKRDGVTLVLETELWNSEGRKWEVADRRERKR